MDSTQLVLLAVAIPGFRNRGTSTIFEFKSLQAEKRLQGVLGPFTSIYTESVPIILPTPEKLDSFARI